LKCRKKLLDKIKMCIGCIIFIFRPPSFLKAIPFCDFKAQVRDFKAFKHSLFYFHFGKMFYFMMLSFNWKDDFWLHRFETNCCFLNFLISAFSFGEINEFVLVRVELPTPLNSLKVGELEDNRQSKKMLKWVSKSRWRHTIT
jgi:hypothetical protein